MKVPSIVFLLTLAGMASAQEISGRVVDNASGQPVSQAHVAVSWSFGGADIVGSRTSCTDLQVAKTDDLGEFRVTGRAPPSAATVKVFKAGLETHKRAVDKNERWEIRLMPLSAPVDVRKREYGTFWILTTCGDLKKVRQKLLPIGEEIDRELLALDPSRPPYFVRRLNEIADRPQ